MIKNPTTSRWFAKFLAIVLSLLLLPMIPLTAQAEDYTLTLVWRVGVEDEEDVIDKVEVKNGAAVIPDKIPFKTDLVFAGWHVDEEFGRGSAAPTLRGGFGLDENGQFVTFPDVFKDISGDATYYARWIDPAKNIRTIDTKDGSKSATLGYSLESGVKLIFENGKELADPVGYDPGIDGPVFKDLNHNGKLDPYEDWRLSTDKRAKDLAKSLIDDEDGVHQIAGLMLYSAHQMSWVSSIPMQSQIEFLVNDDLRHILIAGSADATNPGNKDEHVTMGLHAKWNNNIQTIAEGLGFGIPANNSSDPRHGTSSVSSVEFYTANTGVSAWPSSLGLAATFDPAVTKEFGIIASLEYRAMGIATALSPQIDIATDPRWGRFSGTFGEDPFLASEMAKAYVDGFQTTYDKEGKSTGWGMDSVNAMIKHWPGGGSGEGGRDAHFSSGKYAIYPGGNWNAHLIPFVDGSLSLKDGTGMASAVMPYYTISYMQVPGSEPNSASSAGAELNMANAYSDYMINGVLRDAYEYEGVVCTDWNVIGPILGFGGFFDPDMPGMIWGVDDHFPESAPKGMEYMAERTKMLLAAGVDQFGGLNTVEPIMMAYEDTDDKGTLEKQLEMSAVRLLKNIFNTGLFENPYLDDLEAENLIGNEEFMKAGYEAQIKSTVLLKNRGDLLPLAKTDRIYAPDASSDTVELLEGYFGKGNVSAESSTGADVAIVFMSSVDSGGGTRSSDDGNITFSNSYAPINLDYKSYTANRARMTSIAGEPIRDSKGNIVGIENRSYRGETTPAFGGGAGVFFGGGGDPAWIQLKRLASAKGSGLPVIVVITVKNPLVLEEIEPSADAILAEFESQQAAIFDLIVGSTKYGKDGGGEFKVAPTALLPMQLPKNMDEVETQCEDVPRDMECYVDSEGNVYDFGFGLTYGTGEPIDESVNPGYAIFVKPAINTPENLGNANSKYYIGNRAQVTFDYGYKEDSSDKTNRTMRKVVNKGSAVTDAGVGNLPDRAGDGNIARFTGWYDGDVKYDFSAPVTGDFTLIAKWRLMPALVSPPPAGPANPPAAPPDSGPGSGSGSGSGTEPGSGSFSDVLDSAWYRDAVYFVRDYGLFEGVGDGLFAPMMQMDRAMFVTVLGRLAAKMGETVTGFNNPFTDVQPGLWYTNYVGWGAAKDIVKGYTPTIFEPKGPVTREQMAALFIRFADYMGLELGEDEIEPFADAAKISGWAVDSVNGAAEAGIIVGDEQGLFRPRDSATRADAATMFMRLVRMYVGTQVDSR